MLQEITIKNFKSIVNDTIELGRVNVFIGENGCGKSNILEAVGFASAAVEGRANNENLFSKGIRIAKPMLTVSNFKGNKPNKNFSFRFQFKRDTENEFYKNFKEMLIQFSSPEKENINSKWTVNIGFNTYSVTNELTKVIEESFGGKSPSSLLKLATIWLKGDHSSDNSFLGFMELHERDFLIYALNTLSLRGLIQESRKEPVGVYGENMDVLLTSFNDEEIAKLKDYQHLITWMADFFVDKGDLLKLQGYKLNRSLSMLYFSDKYMQKKNNIFSSENANEGILHILFYLAVMISKHTPKFFAIDNIESCLNPHLCRHLMEEICKLAKSEDKQLLITTHNPAILDGLNLFDDEVRLFEVKRNDKGHTQARRITLKPEVQNDMGERYKLSELWTRGYLGAISNQF